MYFVTGATGFIGSSLVRALTDRGDRVRALCRSVPDLPEGADGVAGDLLDPDSVRTAMRGCTRVFHLAAHARAGGPTETYERINVGGTQNIIDAARHHGCERVVFTSTCATLGPSNGEVHDETNIKDGPWFTPYERTKRLAEDLALESGLDAILVHPSRVFGPGPLTPSNSVTRLVDLYRRGLFRFSLGDGSSIGNYVFVSDVVDGHLAAMARGRSGERYLLAGENASLRQFLDRVGECTGRPRTIVGVPPGLVRRLALLEERRASWTGGSPMISADHVDRFLANYAFTTAKAEAELGYAPRSLSRGIRQTLDWLDA